jgi:hypothetical protein
MHDMHNYALLNSSSQLQSATTDTGVIHSIRFRLFRIESVRACDCLDASRIQEVTAEA